MGPRRLWVLVTGMPADAVWRTADGWTRSEELLAELVEVSSHGQIRVPRPSNHKPGNVVSIDEFVRRNRRSGREVKHG